MHVRALLSLNTKKLRKEKFFTERKLIDVESYATFAAFKALARRDTLRAAVFQCNAPFVELLSITDVASTRAVEALSKSFSAMAVRTDLITFFTRVRCARLRTALFSL